MPYKAEYIWIDGTRPTAKLRSKTKILKGGAELPIWGFDGSSTSQAEGHASDRVLMPITSYPDPIRGGADILVLCEVFNTDDTPHESNTRAALREVADNYTSQESLFGIEQEYTFFQGSRPLGFPEGGFPAPQGGYYCGVGADEISGRPRYGARLATATTTGSAWVATAGSSWAGPGSRPSPSTATARPSSTAVPHHVEIRGPLDGASHREPYPTPEEARAGLRTDHRGRSGHAAAPLGSVGRSSSSSTTHPSRSGSSSARYPAWSDRVPLSRTAAAGLRGRSAPGRCRPP